MRLEEEVLYLEVRRRHVRFDATTGSNSAHLTCAAVSPGRAAPRPSAESPDYPHAGEGGRRASKLVVSALAGLSAASSTLARIGCRGCRGSQYGPRNREAALACLQSSEDHAGMD